MNIPGRIAIWTDGACSGNPGPGGWGALLVWNQHSKELKGGAAETTNNRMELTAILKALESLPEGCNVTIHTDSKLCIGWIAKGWRRNVPEVDYLVREIIALRDLRSFSITMEHVKAHNGDRYNELVDRAASREALALPKHSSASAELPDWLGIARNRADAHP